jgi:hypothetical protein
MIINITIPDDEAEMLTVVSGNSRMTEAEYVTSMVRSMCQNRIREFYMGELQKATVDELRDAHSSIEAKRVIRVN